jgi:hypothetical protein
MQYHDRIPSLVHRRSRYTHLSARSKGHQHQYVLRVWVRALPQLSRQSVRRGLMLCQGILPLSGQCRIRDSLLSGRLLCWGIWGNLRVRGYENSNRSCSSSSIVKFPYSVTHVILQGQSNYHIEQYFLLHVCFRTLIVPIAV